MARILLSAYACEPHRGSEPGVGWNWAIQAARFHEVWVLTRKNNRNSIERAIEKMKNPPNLHFLYVDLPKWLMFWKKGRRGIHVYYYLWQVAAFFATLKLLKSVHFHLIHHVTFGIAWMPSFLALLPVPFLWGPVGGVETFPKNFLKGLSLRNRISESIKEVAKSLGKVHPFVHLTAKRARLILVQTTNSASYFGKKIQKKTVVYPAVGLDDRILDENADGTPQLLKNTTKVFRVLSVGRLLHIKGFHLGLRAFSYFAQMRPDCEYWIIGDGPEKGHLMRLSAELALEEKVFFFGFLSRQEVMKKMRQCDVFLHPSLRDPPVHVIIEAMACGLPVVCLDTGGPSAQVNEETPIRIPISSWEVVVTEMANALQKLSQNPDICAQMGEAGVRYVEQHYTWDRKAEKIRFFYEQVMNRNG